MGSDVGYGHTLRRLCAAALLLLLAVGFLVIFPAPPTEAITQVGSPAVGYPGDVVTVQVRNDSAHGAGGAFWTFTAPSDVVILSASGTAAGGSSPFGCTGSGASTACGPSGGGGWAANNVVTLQLQISTTALQGSHSGTSAMVSESGTYSVTVLAPPAPTITSPATGLETLTTQPSIAGSKRAGNSVAVMSDGVPICAIAADGSATWSCVPAAPLSYGAHSLTATQSSPGGDLSPLSAAVSIVVLEPAALSIVHSGAAEVVPGFPVAHSVTLSNGGPGVAKAAQLTFDPGAIAASDCVVGGTAVPCGNLLTGVTVGDIAAGASVLATMTLSAALGTPVGTVFALQSSSSSISEAASPVAGSGTVTVVLPAPPTIVSPANGSSTRERLPSISGGGAAAGAIVTVRDDRGTVCTTTANGAGGWACVPQGAFPFGGVRLIAQQTISGLTSADSAAVAFTVLRPVVVPPVVVPPPTPPVVVAPKPPVAPVAVEPLTLNLRFAATRIEPGTAATMRGTLGPNLTKESVTVVLSGTVNKGMAYRSVSAEPDGDCIVSTLSYSCTIVLPPGESASLEIRLYADALNAPAIARQQTSVASSVRAQDNSFTSTIDVGRVNESAALAEQISSFPGPFIPLLALLLFALAATETEKRRRGPAPRMQTFS